MPAPFSFQHLAAMSGFANDKGQCYDDGRPISSLMAELHKIGVEAPAATATEQDLDLTARPHRHLSTTSVRERNIS